MDNLFVIAIGGTGMRCLESFVHLCAVGMLDGQNINILTLDTDQTNGNKNRVENLISAYNSIRTGDAAKDTFFSAKLNLYHFVTPYNDEEGNTYQSLRSKGIVTEDTEDNEELASLFYEPTTVQSFQLDKGYRAQTHLGSMLMYTSIIDAATKVANNEAKYPQFSDLKSFVSKLQGETPSRVFVFGSVFGGTGASSIPVIPKALSKAAEIIFEGNTLSNVKYGSTLLTKYFTFNSSGREDQKREGVIADASFFALNSQAALNFYNIDDTVKKEYQRFYQIGWPFNEENFSQNKESSIGGASQENDSHFVELMAAAAAYDFLTSPIKEQEEVAYLHRCVKTQDGKLIEISSDDLFGDQTVARKFEIKLGGLLSMAHLVLGHHQGAWDDSEEKGLKPFLINNFKDQPEYQNFDTSQSQRLVAYLRLFAYQGNPKGEVVPGWLYQVHNSLHGAIGLFNKDIAFPLTKKDVSEVNLGGLFTETSLNWEKNKGFLGVGKKEKSYPKLVEEMRKHTNVKGNGLEKFLNQFFASIVHLEEMK